LKIILPGRRVIRCLGSCLAPDVPGRTSLGQAQPYLKTLLGMVGAGAMPKRRSWLDRMRDDGRRLV